MLEPEHEAIRKQIFDSWTEEEKDVRRYYKTVRQLCEHVEKLLAYEEKMRKRDNIRSAANTKRRRERQRLERAKK